jgi:hypothetical protein
MGLANRILAMLAEDALSLQSLCRHRLNCLDTRDTYGVVSV